MKYVSEGLKSLFLLNGAATISILTFMGNTKSNSVWLIYAMGIFAIGAATSPIAFSSAYLSQLQYGNAVRNRSSFAGAKKYHITTYAIFGLGLIEFFSGIVFAGCGFLKMIPT